MFAQINQPEAMENYFIVIELPGGDELLFLNGYDSPDNFWKKAAMAVNSGGVQIICKREDTGVSEELRKHITTLNKFTTFILAQIKLCKNEFMYKNTICKKKPLVGLYVLIRNL